MDQLAAVPYGLIQMGRWAAASTVCGNGCWCAGKRDLYDPPRAVSYRQYDEVGPVS